jgi:hypothetical protein
VPAIVKATPSQCIEHFPTTGVSFQPITKTILFYVFVHCRDDIQPSADYQRRFLKRLSAAARWLLPLISLAWTAGRRFKTGKPKPALEECDCAIKLAKDADLRKFLERLS